LQRGNSKENGGGKVMRIGCNGGKSAFKADRDRVYLVGNRLIIK
jgi:hypothetical protein